MINKEKVKNWVDRKKVKLYTQYKENVKGYTLKKEKMYDFYICDYCRMPIKIFSNKKSYEQEGGKIKIPGSLINNESVEIATHNRCIKSLVKELEELKQLEVQKMVDENYEHIPRIN